MRLRVTASPLYEDGSQGESMEREFDGREYHAIGFFLVHRAKSFIGETTNSRGERCDALDVTISEAS